MRSLATVTALASILVWIGASVAEEPRPPNDIQGEKILHCYRPTGHFEKAVAIAETDVLVKGRFGRSREPHDRRALVERHGAATISYLRIYWRGGISGASYVSDVAVLTRTTSGREEYRTELLADTGVVPVVPRVCNAAMGWVAPNKR
ncbi:hypothetical protein [Pinisolibacter sp.]|uniref:hypothetical protein n=1 Tax=Pinisolibacter sp. TaxID=2172024 RepID=UPI002FDE50D0